MGSEYIIYRGQKYNRYPNSKRRQLRVYFYRHSGNKESPFALHRQIWIDNNGEIPKGFVIHHIDGDSLNNDIENLECLSAKEHASNHMREPARAAMSKKNIFIAQESAKAWHSSPEGIAWHKIHGKESWSKRKTIRCHCVVCGKDFDALWKNASVCSDSCNGKKWRQNNPEKAKESARKSYLKRSRIQSSN